LQTNQFETFPIPSGLSNTEKSVADKSVFPFETFPIPSGLSNSLTPETQIIQYAARVVSRK
jgi:hypothetical protein